MIPHWMSLSCHFKLWSHQLKIIWLCELMGRLGWKLYFLLYVEQGFCLFLPLSLKSCYEGPYIGNASRVKNKCIDFFKTDDWTKSAIFYHWSNDNRNLDKSWAASSQIVLEDLNVCCRLNKYYIVMELVNLKS